LIVIIIIIITVQCCWRLLCSARQFSADVQPHRRPFVHWRTHACRSVTLAPSLRKLCKFVFVILIMFYRKVAKRLKLC